MIRVDLTDVDGKYAGTVYACHMGYSERSMQEALTRFADDWLKDENSTRNRFSFKDYLIRTGEFREGATTTFHFQIPG